MGRSNNKPTVLYANGCSWTAGNGIEHDPLFQKVPVDNLSRAWTQLSWPAHLSSLIGADTYINDAMGGGSNQRIVRTTCDFIRTWARTKDSNLVVVIGWTSCERREIYAKYHDCAGYISLNPWQKFSDQIKNSAKTWSKYLIKELTHYHWLHSRYLMDPQDSTGQFLREVWLLSNMLDNLGIKYLFFSSISGFGFPGTGIIMDDAMAATVDHMSHPRFMGMDKDYTMSRFCYDQGHALSPCHHPMISAHKAWAEHLDQAYKRIYNHD